MDAFSHFIYKFSSFNRSCTFVFVFLFVTFILQNTQLTSSLWRHSLKNVQTCKKNKNNNNDWTEHKVGRRQKRVTTLTRSPIVLTDVYQRTNKHIKKKN